MQQFKIAYLRPSVDAMEFQAFGGIGLPQMYMYTNESVRQTNERFFFCLCWLPELNWWILYSQNECTLKNRLTFRYRIIVIALSTDHCYHK